MNKNNVKCVICGKEYKYCHDCNHTELESWKSSFCSENCREIYRICAGFGMKHITKEEAAKALAKCDLSEMDKYTDSTKRLIREIRQVDEQPEAAKVLTETVNKPARQNFKRGKRK